MDNLYLPLIRVGSLTDGNSVQLEEADDEVSDPIDMPDFPFGNSTQTIAYVRCSLECEWSNSSFLLGGHKWTFVD